MPPRHDIPIEDADLWDILDWDVVAALAAEAGDIPHRNPPAAVANKLIELGSARDGCADVDFFHRAFTRFVTCADAAARRAQAGQLAQLFGADPERLIDYAAFKWGLFKRASRPKR